MFNQFFKSLVEQDDMPVVFCDTAHTILYMNPAAIAYYAKQGGKALLGRNLMDCHKPQTAAAIERILSWFQRSKENNRVHTLYSAKDHLDVYVIALRDEDGNLIGYYEQQILRLPDESAFYQMD